MVPAATWMFWLRIAWVTSSTVNFSPAMRSGSNQTRILYSPAPKSLNTAHSLEALKWIFDLDLGVVAQVFGAVGSIREIRLTSIRKFGEFFCAVTPI